MHCVESVAWTGADPRTKRCYRGDNVSPERVNVNTQNSVTVWRNRTPWALPLGVHAAVRMRHGHGLRPYGLRRHARHRNGSTRGRATRMLKQGLLVLLHLRRHGHGQDDRAIAECQTG